MERRKDRARAGHRRRMPASSNVFEVCRGISALEVARHHHIPVVRRGGRLWTACPLHEEKDPSLLFDKLGRWHCFGCGQGGDAVDLHSALRGLSLYAAAVELMGLLRAEWFG